MWYFILTNGIGELERFTTFPTRQAAMHEVLEMEMAGGGRPFKQTCDWTDEVTFEIYDNLGFVHIQFRKF